MNLKKFDIQINLKNEKEIKRFLSLLISTALLTMVLFEAIDYIWNIPVYKICKLLFPCLVAVPSLVYYIRSGRKLKELFAGNIKIQIAIGLGIGIALASFVLLESYISGDDDIGMVYMKDMGAFIYTTVYYLLVIGPMEEFVYRVGIQGGFEKLLGKYQILAPLFSSMLFGLSHIIVGGWEQVGFTFVIGMIYGYSKKLIKNCTYLSVSIAHGIYNYIIVTIPYIVMRFSIS